MTKNKKQKILLFILLTTLAVFIAGCNNNSTGNVIAEQKETLTIGVIAPLTGDAASYGLAAKEGLDFAVSEINIKGGVLGRQIELVYEDSQHDSKHAVSIMNKFINVDKYDIVIAADGSGPTTAVDPLADQTNTLIIATLASTPQLTSMGDYVFRTVPSDAYQGTELAEFADKQGFETAAILYANDAYGVGIKDIFTANFNGEIISIETFENGASDFRTQLTKIKNENPDVIILIVRKELPNVLKQINTLKIDSALIGSETTKDYESIKLSGSTAEGMYSISFSESQDYANYKKNFISKNGKEPATYSDYSYDAIYALKRAIESANSFNSEEIKDALYTVKFYGASDLVSFDSNGDATSKPMTMYEVKNGEFISIS